MPKWRKLHEKTLDSVDINAMPDDFTRLTWLLLPLILDCKGRAIDNSAWLRSKVYPMREDVTTAQVEQAMCWYAERGMVERYEVDGRCYFLVPTFAKYQGNTDREAESVIPDPVKQAPRKPRQSVTTNSRPTHEQVTTKSRSDVDADTEVDTEEKTRAGGSAPASVPEPDPVKELAVIFEQASGIKRPEPTTKSGRETVGVTWWKPLREMVQMANGSAAGRLQEAVIKMRRDDLTIKAPASVLSVFTSLDGKAKTSAAPPRPAIDPQNLTPDQQELKARLNARRREAANANP